MITTIDVNTALVIIDLQKGIAKDTVHPINKLLDNAALLVAGFRNAGLPIVIVNVNPTGAAWTKARVEKFALPINKDNQTTPKIVIPIKEFTEIAPQIITQPTDIFITKKTWNAFFETNLQFELQNKNITGIVLAGISTSIGVEGTARSASELGYNITFITDAISDKLLGPHNNSIENIFPRIGELGTSNELLSHLAKR